jgi:gluconolactonase
MAALIATLLFLPPFAHSQAGIPGVVAPGVQPELVQEGFKFTEGPVGTPDGGLYFSDIQGADRTYRLDPGGIIRLVREHTNGANGLAILQNGSLLAAEGDGKQISKRSPDGQVRTVTDSFHGKPFLRPNDLIVDSKGGIYFTDPGPRPWTPARKGRVYYLPAGAKEPRLIDDAMVAPNGLTLTRDGKTLIVDDTASDMVSAFDVQTDGTARNKRPFARLHDMPAGQESGADGMALDREGRVYVATVTGVQVFDGAAHYLGTIKVPRQPANLAFSGPDKRTLYITAREGLYRLKMLSQGPDRLGK